MESQSHARTGNYMGAVGKIMMNSGAEDILVETGLCKLGMAKKIFGSAGDYFQSLCAHQLLCEALANLLMDAFEELYLEKNDDAQFCGLADDLENTCNLLDKEQNAGQTTGTDGPL